MTQQDTAYYTNTDMALSPNTIASANLQLFPFKQAEIALLSKYAGSQFLDNTGDQNKKIRGYFVQDLRLGYSLQHVLAKEISLLLQVNNLWNRKYETNGYTYSYIYDNSRVTENFFYPMAGRNLLIAANIKF